MPAPHFIAHNIRLSDGSTTIAGSDVTIDQNPVFTSTRTLLDLIFPANRSSVRLVDLGCLEGGYAVQFARLGFDCTGLEVRDSNIAACRYVKEQVGLDNLTFVQDNVWNLARHGPFDVVFCNGLYYHVEHPVALMELLASQTRTLLILNTHFATEVRNERHNLSDIDINEGVAGRWYMEFGDDQSFGQREIHRESSWDNRRSFWLMKEELLHAMKRFGFDLVFEQFDQLAPRIAEQMRSGGYRVHDRGQFIGIKTGGIQNTSFAQTGIG